MSIAPRHLPASDSSLGPAQREEALRRAHSRLSTTEAGGAEDGVSRILENLNPVSDERSEDLAREAVRIQVEATRLGAEVLNFGGEAPFEMEGSVDGVRFFLRERWGTYEVRVPDEEAGDDADPADTRNGVYVIDEGCDTDLYGHFGCEDPGCSKENSGYDPVQPLRVAVRAVRRYLRQRSCDHSEQQPEDVACAQCGTHLTDPLEWR